MPAANRSARQPQGRRRRALRPRVGLQPGNAALPAQRGIAIDDRCVASARQPFDGPMTVRFGDAEVVLGGTLARAVRVALDHT